MEGLIDRQAILQVIGCLLLDNDKISDGNMPLAVNDFDVPKEPFYKIIFACLYNLYIDGVSKIGAFEIDNYLSTKPDQYKIFTSNKGIDFLQNAITLCEVGNYKYYYEKLRKLSALRTLQSAGFNIKQYLPTNVFDAKANQEALQNIESHTLKQIFEDIAGNFANIENDYIGVYNEETSFASVNMRELKEELKTSPEYGQALQGEIYNTIVRGARLTKLYFRSGSTGSGKSRFSVGDACHLAFPDYFDTERNEWIKRGGNEKVLFITTELERDEIQTLILAYLSGINEEIILNGLYNANQEERVNKAIEIVEKHKDNFIIQYVPTFSCQKIESVIKKSVFKYQIQYVFFDYLHTNLELLEESKDFGIREDVSLAIFSAKLKTIANELGIFIMSATQLNADADKMKGIRNQLTIRGSKAIMDKADVGSIISVVGDEDKEVITAICNKLHCPIPNLTIDIFKTRRSRFKNVRIWCNADLGTCRIKDLFCTDAYYNLITLQMVSQMIEFDKMEEEEVPNYTSNKAVNAALIQNLTEEEILDIPFDLEGNITILPKKPELTKTPINSSNPFHKYKF